MNAFVTSYFDIGLSFQGLKAFYEYHFESLHSIRHRIAIDTKNSQELLQVTQWTSETEHSLFKRVLPTLLMRTAGYAQQLLPAKLHVSQVRTIIISFQCSRKVNNVVPWLCYCSIFVIFFPFHIKRKCLKQWLPWTILQRALVSSSVSTTNAVFLTCGNVFLQGSTWQCQEATLIVRARYPTGTWWMEAWNTAQCHTDTEPPLTTNTYAAANFSSAKLKKLYARVKFPAEHGFNGTVHI